MPLKPLQIAPEAAKTCLQFVERAVRFIRHKASQWNADPEPIPLVGGSAGGYLSNMAGLLNAPGDKSAADPVDRENARVQAVVTLFGPSDVRGHPVNKHLACPGSSLIQKLRLPVRSETYLFIPASQLRHTLTGGLKSPSGADRRNCWPSAAGA